MLNKSEALKRAYYSLDSASCYSGADKIYKAAKLLNAEITREDVEDYLIRQRTYTLYKPVVRKFKRLRTKPNGLNTDWQADLADMRRFSEHNQGYCYFLVCVDVLSRRMYTEPLRRTTSVESMRAFDAIFESSRVLPWKLFTDNGNEFESAVMRKYFDKKDILKFSAKTNKFSKASVAERAIRTIKERLYKYFSEQNTLRWIDALPRLVQSINNSVCRVTGMAPNDVNENNAGDLMKQLYHPKTNAKNARYHEGDYVRIAALKPAFAKHTANYTDQIFRVKKVLRSKTPPVYKLVNGLDQELDGYFYEAELTRTVRPTETTTRVEKIIRSRRRGDGKLEHLVKWLDHSDNFNTWVCEDEFVGEPY